MTKILRAISLVLFLASNSYAAQPEEIISFFSAIIDEYNDFKNCDDRYQVAVHEIEGGGKIVDPFGTGYLYYAGGRLSAGFYGHSAINFKRVYLDQTTLSYRLEWVTGMFGHAYTRDVAFILNDHGELNRFVMKTRKNKKLVESKDCSRE